MYFTKEDILKIQQALSQLGVKDSELQETSLPKWNDYITIVQDNKNKKVSVQKFLNQFVNESFINLTAKYDTAYVSIKEAIKDIPITQRKKGLLISFIDTNKEWKLYQFKGELSQFNNYTLWDDVFNLEKYVVNSLLPDEEDITITDKDSNGNSKLKFKDRKYDPSTFSGMGHKILRKNIVRRVNDDGTIDYINYLSANEFSDSNTIYEIKYDFDLNGKEIQLLENCTLYYNGGSLNNGTIICSNTTLNGIINNNNVSLQGTYNLLDLDIKINEVENRLNEKLEEVSKPDEEDITISSNNKLSFKDRPSENGMGYIIVRNNQDLISQITLPNTIYEIRYNFDLQKRLFTMPNNCTLLFNGGSFLNGTLKLNNTRILQANESFKSSLNVLGTVSNVIVESTWWEMPENDCFPQIKRIIAVSNNSEKPIYFKKGTYTLLNDGTDNTIIKQSVDFGGSTFILNTNKLLHFSFIVRQQEATNINSEDYSAISKAIQNKDLTAEVFKKYKNCLLKVESDETELIRSGYDYAITKLEDLYVDINGYVQNIPFNKSMNVSKGTYIKCDNVQYLKNLKLVIEDTFTGTQSSTYRYLGFIIQRCSNLTIENFIIPDPEITKYTTMLFYVNDCYNLQFRDCCFTNTKDNLDYVGNEHSAYVLHLSHIVKLYFNNLQISNFTSHVWGATGTNYITDWVIENSSINRIDTHYRLNNLYVNNCVVYHPISYTGFGKISIYNTKILGQYILGPRSDYGAFFDGDIIIENCEILNNENQDAIFMFSVGLDNTNNSTQNPEHYKYLAAKNIYINNLKCNYKKDSRYRVFKIEYLSVPTLTNNLNRVYPNVSINNVKDVEFRLSCRKQQAQIFEKNDVHITLSNCEFIKCIQGHGLAEPEGFTDYNTESQEYFDSAPQCYNTIIDIINCKNVVPSVLINNTTLNVTNCTIQYQNAGYQNYNNTPIVNNSTIIMDPSVFLPYRVLSNGYFNDCVFSAIKTDNQEYINLIKNSIYARQYTNGKWYFNYDKVRLYSCRIDSILAGYLDDIAEDTILYDINNVKDIGGGEGELSSNPLKMKYYAGEEGQITTIDIAQDIAEGYYRFRLNNSGSFDLILSDDVKANTVLDLWVMGTSDSSTVVQFKNSEGTILDIQNLGSNLALLPGWNEYKVFINKNLQTGKFTLSFSQRQFPVPSHNIFRPYSGYTMIRPQFNAPVWWTGNKWIFATGQLAEYPLSGTQDNRPLLEGKEGVNGFQYYNNTLKQPCWWDGEKWITFETKNADIITKGTTEQRPTLTIDDEGFQYYDTTLHKPIWWNGTQWIDGTNTPV